MTPIAFRRLAWGTAAYTLLAILWGYFLRISETGDGCATDWPLCLGDVVPKAPEFSTLIEFSHRLSSGLVLVLALLLAVAAFRTFPKGHAIRKAAAAALLFTLTEALVGAILVVFGWVAGDISLGRIIIRPFHVTNTFLLMASMALTAWWATRGVAAVPRPTRAERRPLLLPILGVLALAWTGAWTGLAVTAFPAETIGEGLAQYSETPHFLITLRLSHPILAVLVILVLVRFARHTRARAVGAAFDHPAPDRGLARLAVAIGALALLQLAAGPLTIVAGNPAWMRLLHLLLADLLWVAVVLAASAHVEVRGARPVRDVAEPRAVAAGASSG